MASHVIAHMHVLDDWKQSAQALQKDAGNTCCADCTSTEVGWSSVTFGNFLCNNCSTVHKSLGEQVSRVLNLQTDNWDERSYNVSSPSSILNTVIGNYVYG